MADRVVPRSWTQLRSSDQLRRWRQREGVIVILDEYTPSHFHHPGCDDVRTEFFDVKKANGWKNGAYYWAADGAAAAGYATACASCGGQVGAVDDTE